MISKELRTVFMGTPDFAVGILDKLVEDNYNIVCVITAPDKPAGRGKKLKMSAVKKYALEKGISVLQPSNLKDKGFITDLKKLKVDLQVVVAFRMLPKEVWQIPEYGTFNLHASLLPAYRGAAPINWAIINGEKETGVTTFFIDEKIDTGEIILQNKTHITSCETAGSLHDRLMHLGSDLVIKTIDLIASNDFKTKKQPKQASSVAPKLLKETSTINWKDSLQKIYNKIRGLSPYPAAWCNFSSADENYMMKIYHARPEHVDHQDNIGKIISDKKSLKVAVKDGYLYLDEVQLSGKRRMDVTSLLNGFRFSDDAIMLT